MTAVPDDIGNVRVQFIDQSSGNATGPAVTIPIADASIKNLETLLNTLQGNVGMMADVSSNNDQETDRIALPGGK